MILSRCRGGGRGIIRSQLIATELKLANVGCMAHVSSKGACFFVDATLIRHRCFLKHRSRTADVKELNYLRSKSDLVTAIVA